MPLSDEQIKEMQGPEYDVHLFLQQMGDVLEILDQNPNLVRWHKLELEVLLLGLAKVLR